MAIYFIVALILFLGSVGEQFLQNEKIKKYIYISLLIFVGVFIGTRSLIGYDWYSYKPNFENLPTIVEVISGQSIRLGAFEKGFQIYSLIIKSIYRHYFFYTFVNTLVDFTILYLVIKKYSKFPILTLFLFFSIYGLALEVDMLRNAKSILLFLLSVEYIEKRDFKMFFLFNFIGFFFHGSALLYLPMYFILNKNWNKKVLLVIFILGNIYYLLDMRLFIKLLKVYNGWLPIILQGKFGTYLSIVPLDFSLGFTFFYIERVILFLLAWTYYEKIENKKYGKIMANSLFISVFLFLFSSEFSIISFRVQLLFIYAYWFLIPMLLEVVNRGIIIVIACIISMFRLYNQLYFPSSKEMYLYKNIFLHVVNEKERKEALIRNGVFKKMAHGKEISILF